MELDKAPERTKRRGGGGGGMGGEAASVEKRVGSTGRLPVEIAEVGKVCNLEDLRKVDLGMSPCNEQERILEERRPRIPALFPQHMFITSNRLFIKHYNNV